MKIYFTDNQLVEIGLPAGLMSDYSEPEELDACKFPRIVWSWVDTRLIFRTSETPERCHVL